jgi:hypothetical protein
VHRVITSHSSRTNNSWLFAPSSLILANHYLPLNGALYAKEAIVKYWRGIGVIIFWPLWILPAFLIALSVFGFDGQCAVDNCNPEDSRLIDLVGYILIYFAPPSLLTILWLRWRRKFHKNSAE